MKTPKKTSNKKQYVWNLKCLYASPTDPQIEKDVADLEKSVRSFAQKYDVPEKKYLADLSQLLEALRAYEKILEKSNGKPLLYFYFLRDIEAANAVATAQISLLENRMTHIENLTTFFAVALGAISAEMQKKILADARFNHFKVLLFRIFSDARHMLSVPEEKIMNLKSIPSYNMWISGNQRMLNQKSVLWKKKNIPLAQALGIESELPTQKERMFLSKAISTTLKTVAPFSEAELNAVVTNKKINDELRNFKTAYEETVVSYRNDPQVIENLVKTVTDNFHIAHRFYKVKAKLLKLKRLSYSDRAAKIGSVRTKFTFESTVSLLNKTFGSIDPKYASIFNTYIAEGRIDVFPRVGKKSGAYCWGSYGMPTYVLLNHNDSLRSFSTAAHEMGHAFHTELSNSQGPLYNDYSTALAETASTLFETIAIDAVYDSLPDKEKITILHDRINDQISTIFRQIACFNYENNIHAAVKTKGFVSEQELAQLHNKNMAEYLGPLFKLTEDDGYYFVHWGHLRRFFYVYSYAYGMLVSKALLRRYRKDKTFWKSIEQFLSAGGKDSPENIMKEIGVDMSKPDFFLEGLKEIEDDIKKLEDLASPKKPAKKRK